MSTLTSGTRIGPYEVQASIGAGGMGEVYRARDTRLDRTVALKVLSSGLADDPQSRERFEREARAISSLNHPNICVLHDVGRERPVLAPGVSLPTGDSNPPVDFLVIEYLEGETLAARLGRGPLSTSSESQAASPSLSVPETLGIAIQIASALDGAHRQGIVHRDLKPGNVMLTVGARRGAPPSAAAGSVAKVKLLDFGLARVSATGPTERQSSAGGLVSMADLSMPTMSSPLTMKGTILGTLHYMAPEQLQGKEVDARADIFAFGVVLYEMLTGRRPFDGKSQASLIGAILDHEPPAIASLQPAVPPLLDELVARCLAKTPDDRWQTARDLLRQLVWIAADRSGAVEPATAPASPPQARVLGRMLRTAALVALGAAVAGGLGWSLRPKRTAPPLVSRFAIELPADQALTRTGRRVIAMSPDGSRLAYVANKQIYLRPLNELTAAPIAGTAETDPSEPVFSPDGQWLAFWSNGQLEKVPAAGGTPIVLSDVQNPNGMSWQGERLVLGQLTPPRIITVPAIGGTPAPLITLDEKQLELAQSPQLVAGGRAVLFTLRLGNQPWDDATIVVQDLATGVRNVLVKGGTHARVLPSGHLVYARHSTLFAAPFDEATLSLSAGAAPVQQGVQLATGGFSGTAQATWSDAGGLAYIPVGPTDDRTLVWLDRQGHVNPTAVPDRRYQLGATQMRIAPDGKRVAMTVVSSSDAAASQNGADIWVWDIARGALTRLSFTTSAESPVWSPDGRRICYQSAPNVWCQPFDGSGQPEPLLNVANLINLGPMTPDGRQILLHVQGGKTFNDIRVAALDAPNSVKPLIETPAAETSPALSPDGRWLAYSSNESGTTEVYVRPFPGVETGRWQISNGGGSDPRWASNGRELFFLDLTGSKGASAARAIMAVPIAGGPTFLPGKPIEVVKYPDASGRGYDVAPDGRFLINVPRSSAGDPAPSRAQIVVVQHWVDELEARVPAKH